MFVCLFICLFIYLCVCFLGLLVPSCGEEIKDSRTVTTPYYPLHYPSNFSCTWIISRPTPGFKCLLIFNDFQLANTYPELLKSPGLDYLLVRNGTDPDSPVVGNYSGTQGDGMVLTSADGFHLSFQSDVLFSERGFSANVTDIGKCNT